MSGGGESCAVCDTANAAFRCSQCRAVRYCSAAHQREHWKVHRAHCGPKAAPQPINADNAHAVPLHVMNSFLDDLVRVYSRKEFQAELESARKSSDFMAVFGRVVATVQYPVLKKYGFEASPEGVNVMKQAALHAIVRGSPRVREMADKACELLKLPALLPEVTPDLMARQHDEMDNWEETLKVDELRHTLRAYADIASRSDAEGARRLVDHLVEERNAPKRKFVYYLWARVASFRVPPTLWFQREPEVVRLRNPSRDEFFAHVRANRPVIISGAITEANFAPLKLFNDLDFLRRTCGHRLVGVKGKSFDQGDRRVFMMDPGLKMPFRAFLDLVEAQDSTHYYMGKVTLKENLPEMLDYINSAPGDVRKQFGDCFGTMIDEGIYTYFGIGANTSSCHYDPHENMMVCVAGTKILELFPIADSGNMYPCKPPSLSNSSVPPFNPRDDPVLRERFPDFLQTKPIRAEVRAGDILYLPIFWWHSVTSEPSRNIILNYWFDMHPSKLLPMSPEEAKVFSKGDTRKLKHAQ